jgi:beta-hydroxyacyl-ACP dehydratase FabZ
MQKNIELNIQQILQHLPHRYPFILIDKIIQFSPLPNLDAMANLQEIPVNFIVAIKNVTINEPFFQGHFPGNPIMPGVLIVEAMAQTTSILALAEEQITDPLEDPVIYLLASIEKVRFKKPVRPGDQLKIEAKLVNSPLMKHHFYTFNVIATVEGVVVCQATITGRKTPAKQAQTL